MEFLRSFFRKSFRGETVNDVAKCRLFSQATLFARYDIFKDFFVHLKNVLCVCVFYKLFKNAFIQCKTQLNQSNSIEFFLRPGVGRVN